MTTLRLFGAALCGACLLAPLTPASAQTTATDEAPTAPTVPPTSQIAASPMPARRAELDKAASRADFPAVKAILGAAANMDDVNRNMDWEELQVVQGGSVFYSLLYLDDFWLMGTKFPNDPNAATFKRFAGVIGLYALQQIQIDGTRCADPSAPGHRIDQLTAGRGPVWQYGLALPEVTRRDLAVEALKLEARTAKLRRDDPVLCSGGVQNMAQALKDDKTPLSATSGGHRDVAVTPVPTYVDPAVSAPKQAQSRRSMPLILARLLKLSEAQPK
jgi:hypothetical protein